MAFQGEFTQDSVDPMEGFAKGPVEGSTKGPMEGSTKGASQDFLLSMYSIADLSERLKVVLPFLP